MTHSVGAGFIPAGGQNTGPTTISVGPGLIGDGTPTNPVSLNLRTRIITVTAYIPINTPININIPDPSYSLTGDVVTITPPAVSTNSFPKVSINNNTHIFFDTISPTIIRFPDYPLYVGDIIRIENI